ncbi:hypothetical protein [Streptomyces chryseus]|uniref:Lipoprotein n=1 Tax=Streptomyces chryseus TaxID=68186 RepID=A0ABQ3EG92_9ACTN|nr:hypothetical protein [Streptomyces chryseus]GHB31385.1 hypothetical protein GCM10010346_63480 [Streptomyces chryseus]
MGRHAAVPTALLAVLLAAGCTNGTSSGDDARSNDPGRTSGQPSAKPTETAKVTGLDLPTGAQVLVPQTSGTGNADLPKFKPRKDVYTVHARCTGDGTMTIIDRNRPKDSPTNVSCKGPITIGRIYTDITTQALGVRIRGGDAKWSIAIVSGEHKM